MSSPTLRPEIKEKIQRDEALIVAMAQANGVKSLTIIRWLKDDYRTLTTYSNLQFLQGRFGGKIEDLLELSSKTTPAA
jgi:hypothetical protein